MKLITNRMTQTGYDRYLAEQVLGADPLKLVWLLYRGAIDAVRCARGSLDQGDIRGRARQINRAWAMIQELSASLNHAEGGEISQRLAALYAYMQTRLIEANIRQSAGPLEEVESLLVTLAEAWSRAGSHPTGLHPEGAQPAVAQPEGDRPYDPSAEAEHVALAVG